MEYFQLSSSLDGPARDVLKGLTNHYSALGWSTSNSSIVRLALDVLAAWTDQASDDEKMLALQRVSRPRETEARRPFPLKLAKSEVEDAA